MPTAIDAANFTSTRQSALHHLGTALPDAGTAAQALKFGRLSGWNVRKTPLYAHVAGQQLLVPNQYAIVRDNPHTDNQVDVLGGAGNIYKVLQNEDLEDLLDTLVEESGATYALAGEWDGGSEAFVSLRMPGVAKVGTDNVSIYITATNSHSGNSSACLMVTPVRESNQTTLNLAFKGAKHLQKVRHTTHSHAALHAQARDALEFTYNYLDSFEEVARQLLGTALTQARFEELIHRNFGAPKGAAAPTVTRTQNKLDSMAELFSDSFSQSGIRGTAWAGLTALVEWSDHFSPVRGTDPGTTRSLNALMDPAFKNKALKMMMELV